MKGNDGKRAWRAMDVVRWVIVVALLVVIVEVTVLLVVDANPAASVAPEAIR